MVGSDPRRPGRRCDAGRWAGLTVTWRRSRCACSPARSSSPARPCGPPGGSCCPPSRGDRSRDGHLDSVLEMERPETPESDVEGAEGGDVWVMRVPDHDLVGAGPDLLDHALTGALTCGSWFGTKGIPQCLQRWMEWVNMGPFRMWRSPHLWRLFGPLEQVRSRSRVPQRSLLNVPPGRP